MKSKLLALVSVLILFSASPPPAAERAGMKGSELFKLFRSSKPDEPRAVKVHKAQIDMGLGTLVLDDGVLVPSEPVNGQVLEITFVGEGWFRFSTPDPVERRQLELFTGEAALVTPVSHAVLVTGDQGRFESILSGEQASGDQVREAAKVFKRWVEGAERQGFAADLAMVKSQMGDSDYQGYFAVWSRSPEHDDFYYVIDPSRTEQVLLGQFVPLDLSALDVWEQRYIKNFMRRYKFFGRFADFSVEHPGQWDTWVSTSPPGAAQNIGAEPEHYTLDLYVSPAVELDTKGSARIRLRTGTKAARTIVFSLYAGLKVTAVFGPDGEPLDFIRREDALHVFFTEPTPPGVTVELRVDYAGDLVEGRLLDTLSWYPRTGLVNRATYTVTLRRPKKFNVVASGRTVEAGEKDGVAWERRVLELPAFGFTFEIGDFDIVRDRAGHVEITFALSEWPDSRIRDSIISTVKRSLAFFEEKFGPYPLDYMTVTNVSRGFSQGMLSMVTLASGAMHNLRGEHSKPVEEWAEEQRALTVAHEVSHQWWGNWVGWSSYRDQWLSEALASYSALQAGAAAAESKATFMARNARDWRSSLTDTTADGRTVASLGPVTIGARLDSSKSGDAYQAIVYDKGSVVFQMLSRIIGEEPFTRMLGELARAVANRTIDTPTFLKSIERMSGTDLRWFGQQFIEGTAIPDVYYRYTIEQDQEGKGWAIRGEAQQVGSGYESLKLATDASGAWTVVREKKLDLELPSTLVVPCQIIITPPDKVRPSKPGEVQSARGFGGRLVLKGKRTPFSFKVPEKPERLELDQLGEVLALFHDQDRTPKRSLRLQAMDLASADPEAAEALLRQALESVLYSERAIAWMNPERRKNLDQQEETRFEDARVHTSMARLLVNRDDFEGAEREMAAAEKLLKEPDKEAAWSERRILRGRIELARRNPTAAYERLKGGHQKWWLGAEGNALLAVAASESGHERVAEQAAKQAETLGVDMQALREEWSRKR